MTIDRRRFLISSLGLGAAAAGAEGLVLEPHRVSLSRHRIGAPRDENHRPLRLTLLTDLHLKSIGRREEAVAALVDGLETDILLLVGDSIDRPNALPVLGEFLSLLPSAVPKYATLGNWEYWSGVSLPGLAEVCGRFTGRLLVNESVSITHDGAAATLVGLDDLVGGRPDLEGAWPDPEQGGEGVLLSHCPALRDLLPAGPPVRAMLAGHTHGGQVSLFGFAPFRPGGSGRYVSGWYRDGALDLYVSRGIGTSVVPVRLGSTPEVAFFAWFLNHATAI